MKHLKLLYLLSLVLVPALCQAMTGDRYGYPIQGSYGATIMGTPEDLKAQLPTEIRTQELVLNLTPNLNKPDIFFYDHGLRCTLAYQKKKAPLAFLIAGTWTGHCPQHQRVRG